MENHENAYVGGHLETSTTSHSLYSLDLSLKVKSSCFVSFKSQNIYLYYYFMLQQPSLSEKYPRLIFYFSET